LTGLFVSPVQILYNGIMTTEPAPKLRKRENQISSLQIMFAAILAIGLLLAINFSSRITAGQPLQEAYNRAVAEIEQLKREQVALTEERDFTRSDAFVERWARDDGKMVRGGERLVVPVPSNNSLPQTNTDLGQTVTVETTAPSAKPLEVWWALFFDSPPPDIN
jgi:cell division protein FtsB